MMLPARNYAPDQEERNMLDIADSVGLIGNGGLRTPFCLVLIFIFCELLSSRDFSYNNFSDLNFTRPNNDSYMNLFAASPTATSPLQIMNEYCSNERSKYNSLNINCGGEGTIIEGKYYEEDNKTSAFYVSPNRNWAYSRSGNFLRTDTKPGDYIRNMTCGIPVSDAPLYATARISPLSLKYHGLCLHNGNYTVKLHFAEIIYTDDKDYSIMGKRIFDVYIQGNRVLKDFNIIDESKGPNEVVIKNFSATVMDHTLEIHFYWAGKGSVYIPPYLYGPLISAISVIPDFELHKKELSTLVKIMIAVSSFAILLLVSASVWKIGLLRRKRLHDNVPIKIQGSSVTSITFRDIMEATQNFNPKMEIGKGGFGTVYKAELKQKGIIMAVKQLSPNSKQGTDEINNEVYSLSSLKHENLVQLLGAYSGNNQNLLLYEYMENNSLARALFDPQSSLKLSWQIRYKICLGIAKGLTYLHEESRLKIVHRDIKATNILLDKDLKAKISDFGLAKLYDRDSTHMVTRAFVYLKNGNILDLVDKSVRYEADYSGEQAKMMLNLAMLCTHQSLTLRPTMSEVVSILEGKKTIEEVSITQPPNVFYGAKGFRDYLSTEIPSTSTEVTSSTFSSYLSSKERDEMKNGSVELHREISDESAVTHQPS
ncbi:hypothetical protein HHK36_003356 [Tetracentron sinense]|uniref:non-specific serine/threonine protein kinase n=1 Tax=Tetracentron sinense TaxID=13715 RepID=A0A834ZN24_TETSI|nr:hypothetical protein HHK36_003356 [Tetracentron sinense]